jgi:hypothetical protein
VKPPYNLFEREIEADIHPIVAMIARKRTQSADVVLLDCREKVEVKSALRDNGILCLIPKAKIGPKI